MQAFFNGPSGKQISDVVLIQVVFSKAINFNMWELVPANYVDFGINTWTKTT